MNNSIKAPKTNPKIKADYTKALRTFNSDCNKSLKWWLMSKFNNSTATATALYKEFSKLSNYWVKKAEIELKIPVKKMVNKTLKQSDNHFKKQGIKFDDKIKSHELRDIIQAEINANLALIKSIPRENILRYEAVLYQAINNYDQQSVLKQIKTIGGISDRRAKMIARDQVTKAQETLTLARGKNLGFEYYRWLTMRDERVSGTPGGKYPPPKKGGHYHLDGRIYKIGEPTAIIDSYGTKGKPSDRPNCRCTTALIYLEPNQDLKLIKDSKHGDYYVLVDKISGNPLEKPKPKISFVKAAKPKTQAKNSTHNKSVISSKININKMPKVKMLNNKDDILKFKDKINYKYLDKHAEILEPKNNLLEFVMQSDNIENRDILLNKISEQSLKGDDRLKYLNYIRPTLDKPLFKIHIGDKIEYIKPFKYNKNSDKIVRFIIVTEQEKNGKIAIKTIIPNKKNDTYLKNEIEKATKLEVLE